MTELTEVPVAAPTLSHLPWWRGRPVKVVAIVAVMVIVYQAFGLDYPWPTSLTFTSLSAHLDEFQSWLIDQRTGRGHGPRLHGLQLVPDLPRQSRRWFNQFILWMTWVGATVAGTLVVLALRRSARRGDRRSGPSPRSRCSACGRRAWRRSR